MKSVTSVFLFVTIPSLAIALPSPSAATPQGETLVVTSAADGSHRFRHRVDPRLCRVGQRKYDLQPVGRRNKGGMV